MARDFIPALDIIHVPNVQLDASSTEGIVCGAVFKTDIGYGSTDGDYAVIMGALNDADNYFLVGVGRVQAGIGNANGGFLLINIQASAIFIDFTTTMDDGNWHSIVVGQNLSGTSFGMIDGEPLSAGGVRDVSFAGTPVDIGIGGYWDGSVGQRVIDGKVCNAFWNKYTTTEFTANQVEEQSRLMLQQQARLGDPAVPGSITGFILPIMGESDPEPDMSGNGNSGTLVSAPPVADHAPFRPFWGYDEPRAARARNIDLAADTGSYLITGNAVDLTVASVIPTVTGSYVITGQASDLPVNRVLDGGAVTGSYLISGQAADLLWAATLDAVTGSYVINGQAVNLITGSVLPTVTGSYLITGQAAGLELGVVLPTDTGAYIITGNAANLITGLVIEAATGVYTITGNVAGLGRSFTITTDTGSYTVSGQAADLIAAYVMAAVTGTYVITGNAATLTVTIAVGVVDLIGPLLSALQDPARISAMVDPSRVSAMLNAARLSAAVDPARKSAALNPARVSDLEPN